jgi:hypothetical protein
MSRVVKFALLSFLSLLAAACTHSDRVAREALRVEARTSFSPIEGSASIPSATVTMGTNTRLSASVYDAKGQVVRHLYELAPRTGTVNLRWDGKDDMGYDLPSGAYRWRAITTNATGSDDGGVGDLGKVVAPHPYSASENPALVNALTYDREGNLYVVSIYEESWATLRRIDRANLGTGLTAWVRNMGGGQAIATDGAYVYVAQHATLLRFDAGTGAPAPWPGAPDGISVYRWTKDEMPIPGLAVDAAYVWVVDPVKGRLEAYKKADGSAANIFGGTNSFSFGSAVRPRGIATDGANSFWIAMAGTEAYVQRFVYDENSHTITPSTKIRGLNEPYGVAWYKGGPVSALYVTEIGPGHVRKFDVSGPSPVPTASWLSAMPGPGLVTDTTVGWSLDTLSWIPGGDAAIAVDPSDGDTFGIVDVWNQRTMFYRTTDGGVLTTPRLMGFNFPAPDVDINVGEDWLVSGWQQYHVEYDKRDPDFGHPWELKYNWHPTDDRAGRYGSVSSSVLRKLSNGLVYLYSFVGGTSALPNGGIVVYRLNTDGAGSGMKRCAQIRDVSPADGGAHAGPIEVRTDSNGNGILDDGHGNPDPGDVVSTRIGHFYYPCVWVDQKGTIWLQNLTLDGNEALGVGNLPISSFDVQSNPVYDINPGGALQRVTTLEVDRATGIAEFAPNHLRYDAVGNRLFQGVATPYRYPAGFNYAGGGVFMTDLTTGQSSQFAIPTHAQALRRGPDGKPQVPMRTTVGGIAVDTDGNYFYTGDTIGGGPGQEVRMFTWDGLPVAVTMPTRPLDGAGWLDIGFSLTAFTHPNGIHHVYAEDNGNGRSIRYAFSNVGTTKRSDGTFSWTAPGTANGLVAWWRLDETNGQYVIDSSGNDHFGSAMGFSRDANTWNPVGRWNPTGGLLHGALSFDGKNPNGTGVVLSKSAKQPLPDGVIESSSYSTLTVASWVRTRKAGVIMSYQGDRWGVLPKKYVPLLYVGLDGKARGEANGAKDPLASRSIVNDDRWHHLALVVGLSTQTLYVDGAPQATANGGLVASGMPYTLLGVGYANAADWPQTPQTAGWFYYGGLLDDVRVYGRALSGAEVADLAVPPPPSGPLAWWRFDEATGTVATDSSDHGNDATVTAGTWLPGGGRIGGALSFDGRSTIVTLPNSLMENPAYSTLTFACWFRTNGSGVLLAYQDGPYLENAAAMNGSVVPTLYVGLDGYLYGSVWTNTASRHLKSLHAVNTDTWHHVALVVGSASEYLYVDGNLADQFTPGARWGVLYQSGFLNNQLGVGYAPGSSAPPSWPSTGSFFYVGQIDDARFYGRDMDAAEIRELATVNR